MGTMQINNIKAVNNIGVKNTQSRHFLPAQKPDTFEKATNKFNLDNAMAELSELKGITGKPKFNEEKLEFIKCELSKTPEKWQPFRTLVQNPKVISSIACDFLAKNTEDLKNIAEISQIKENDAPKFSPLELKNISNSLEGKQLEKFKALSNASLGIDNLIKLAQNDKLKNTEKAVAKVNEMKANCPSNILDLKLDTDEYDNDAFAVTATLLDGKKVELLDRDLNRTAIDETQNITRNGKQYQIKKSVDYRNNTTSKVTLEMNKKLPQPVLINEIRVVKDKNGKKVRTEYTTQSEVAGVLNIKHVMPDGSEKIISSAKVDKKTGITTIKKNMESLDGTKTEYLYEDDPKGNRISDYKITDKNGKVLLNNSLSFEVINDKKFISSKNDQKYEITVEDKTINVKDMKDGKTSTINFKNYISGNQDKILTVMKKMPGEELIALSKKTKQLEGIDDILHSTYGAVNKRIKTGDNLFVMLHELGHAKDYGEVDVKEKETLTKSIFNNKNVNEIFEKEKAQFNKAFPSAQRDHINYFIKTSEVGDGIQEAIAESNALLGTYNNDDLFSIRSQYLQQYFPRTIAQLSHELNR